MRTVPTLEPEPLPPLADLIDEETVDTEERLGEPRSLCDALGL